MLSRTDARRVTEQLRLFGCNERETGIYMQCLQLGPASVQQLSRKMRANRITIHSAVEQMLLKGLLFETRRGKRRFIVAEEPVSLLRLLRRKENELETARGNMDHVVRLLTSLETTDHSVPTVKLYEEVEGFKKMLDDTLNARSEVLVFSYVDLFSKLIGPDELEQYFRRRSRKGISTRLLFPPCPFADRVHAKAKEYKIQVRLLPPELHWQSGIFAWNDCLALMSYTEQKLTCTILENRDIAHFYRHIIFELCWAQARPMPAEVR